MLKLEDMDMECESCGIVLSIDDMKDHDDIDCIAWSEMMRKYYNIIG